MTHEEMIEQLENTILLIEQNGKDWWDERDVPILEEAIKAMKMEPCEDCISRQAAIEEIRNLKISVAGKDIFPNESKETIIKTLDELPSVQPEPFINKPCVSEQACREDKMKVLEKIKVEIETEKNAGCHTQYAGGLDFAMSIIDKYMKES